MAVWYNDTHCIIIDQRQQIYLHENSAPDGVIMNTELQPSMAPRVFPSCFCRFS